MISVHGPTHIYNNQGAQAGNLIQGIDMKGGKLGIDMKDGKLADETLSGSLMEFPTTNLVGETAERNLKMIEECLLGDEVRMIGVYGMGGVGKTTIMTHIYNKIKKAEIFDNVIWVTVSNNGMPLEELQVRVLEALNNGNCFKHKDALRRSAKLLEHFKDLGKFLLILDDMWSAFPLDKVGIPEPNEENKCKIVWTTRSEKVCRGMGCEMPVKVDCLTKDESWTLFNKKLGDTVVRSPEIEPIAKDVVDKCGGLPLAIITVGAAMRGVDKIVIWRNALEDLKNSRTEHEGLEGVFPCLKFSFDRLKTQRHKDCFLYCALYPEDYKIVYDKLIEDWMADGFFVGIEDRQKLFDKGNSLIEDLKEACLLENIGTNFSGRKCLKMHDLLRELAISITDAGEMPRFFVKTGLEMVQFPTDELLMKDVVRISLMSSGIEGLSICQPNCPKLSTLFFGRCKMLDDLNPLFFEHMQNLRVLDLSVTLITCLPQSLSTLVNLHALHLAWCHKLKEVPSVKNLGKLRVLNLSHSSIQHLPHGMNGLTNLRCLDLSNTKKLKTFPVGILSSFSRLEELLMLQSGCIRWSSNRNGEVGVEEIATLRHLRKLLVEIMDLNALSSYVRDGNWRHLTCFHIVVRDSHSQEWLSEADDFYSQVRTVAFHDISECMSSIVIPESTRTLKFFHCQNIFPFPCLNSLNQLEMIDIVSSTEEEYIVTETEKPFLPSVSKLWVKWMYNLRTICKQPTQGGTTLANLKHIAISCCPKLKYVFSVGWLQTLHYLEMIEVSKCEAVEEIVVELEEIVGVNDNNNITITLPRLKKLDLSDLLQLQSILKRTLISNSLETLSVSRCEQLKMLPLSIVNIPPSLKEIRVYPMKWWKSLEWDNPGTKSRLKPFLKKALGAKEDEDDEEGDADDAGNATAEEGEEKDDHDHKKDAAADKEEERPGTKRKADRAGLSTWMISYSIVGFFVFVFVFLWGFYIWYDLTYGAIEDVRPPT